LIVVGLAVLFLVGCSPSYQEGIYTDPETGVVYEDMYYVDPAGWSIDRVWTMEDCFPKYWEIKDVKDNATNGKQRQMYAQAWAAKHASGLYKINMYTIRNGTWNFRVFSLDIPDGMRLRWSRTSSVVLFCQKGDQVLRFESEEIFFSKESQSDVYRTADASVTVSNGDNWDVPGKGLLAIARFDFGDHVPDNVLYCGVQGVDVVDTTYSVK